jgi:hypothetical protein
MSNPEHRTTGSIDDDGVDIRRILMVGAISLATFAVSAFVAYLILRSESHRLDARGRPPPAAEIGKDEIGIVDQVDFASDRRLEEWRENKRRRLEGYGWASRSQGLVHIPIEKAIEQVISTGGAP